MSQFEAIKGAEDYRSTGHRCEKIPYEFWLKLFGLIESDIIDKVRDASLKGIPLAQLGLHSAATNGQGGRSIKKLILLLVLFVYCVKRFIIILRLDPMVNALLGDVSQQWLSNTIFYHFPILVYLFTALLIMRRYNNHERELKCYIPFAPIPDLTVSCQCDKRIQYKMRIRLMSTAVLIMVTVIVVISVYPIFAIVHTERDQLSKLDSVLALIWVSSDCVVNFIALSIILFSLLYFDAICLIIGNQFRRVEEVIDEAAFQCLKKRKEQQVFSPLTELFNDYLDINDIVTDSDHFWGRTSFYLLSSHTVIFLFVSYSFIYGEESPFLRNYFIITGFSSLFVLFKVCQSCYDVSYTSAKRGYDNLLKINEFEAPKVVMMKILAFRRYMDSETIGYSGIYTKVTYETLFSWMFLTASLFLVIMDFANGTLITGLSMKYI